MFDLNLLFKVHVLKKINLQVEKTGVTWPILFPISVYVQT